MACIAFGNMPRRPFFLLLFADFIVFEIIRLYSSLAGAEAGGNEASIF